MPHGKIKFLNLRVESISWIRCVRTFVRNVGHILIHSCRYGMCRLPRIQGSHYNKESFLVLWKSKPSQTLMPVNSIRKSPSSNLGWLTDSPSSISVVFLNHSRHLWNACHFCWKILQEELTWTVGENDIHHDMGKYS
jgi:hypothetical protein